MNLLKSKEWENERKWERKRKGRIKLKETNKERDKVWEIERETWKVPVYPLAT